MLTGTNIILYHCNDSERCKKFIESNSGYLIDSKEDGRWLGAGMYFWDNEANSQYWKNDKIRKAKLKNQKTEFTIIKAQVETDNMLDLTDSKICDEIQELFEVIKNIVGDTSSDDFPLGKKLNILFEKCNTFSQKYDIIKIYGKYNITKPTLLFPYNLKSNYVEPTLAVKCIYNVKNEKAIINKIYNPGGVKDDSTGKY